MQLASEHQSSKEITFNLLTWIRIQFPNRIGTAVRNDRIGVEVNDSFIRVVGNGGGEH